MSHSSRKYSAGVSWEDVSTYVREHTRSTGYRADVLLVAEGAPGGHSYAEVHLRPAGAPSTAPAVLIARGPFPGRQVDRQMSLLLHLVAQAYEDLEQNAWLWSPQARRAARGEDG